ncbi:MAG: FAD-dependent monooxygenase [Ilumatobacteraceae bacterium]
MDVDVEVEVDVDVLIVGAGPVGMLGGILADRQGLTALAVERRDGPQTAPAAHVVNARTYEICRQAGLDMQRIFTAGKDPADAGHVNFVTRLSGDLIGRLPFERQGEACLEVHPDSPAQPVPASLRTDPGRRAARLARRRVALPTPVGALGELDDQVISDLVDLDSGDTVRIRSRYVIGCDGAGSRVRKQLGIEMVGPPLLQCFLMIHFAANLRSLTADRPAVLHFTLDPEAPGTFIAHDVESDWVFMHAIDPSTRSVEDYDDGRCREVIERAAGTELDAEILGKGTWWMSSQTADSMGHGRIFLAGDSAHRFPPTGGLGLNSGVQDIHGLMWRLAAIVAGRASEALLDSYEVERIPVAQNNAHQSLTNAIKLVELPAALGTDAEPTTERLHASLADPSRADQIAAAIEAQREHFDLFGLQLGYVYGQGALVPDGSSSGPGSPGEYEPTAQPGARLPHAWVDGVGGTSTLDFVPIDRPVLFTFGDHERWVDRLGGARGGEAIAVVRVGVDTPALDSWRRLCAIDDDGALLVRPDHHVAWRARSGPDPVGFERALLTLAGRS